MFVHLHVHSDNSILNGVIKVEKIVKKTKEYGMPAVALTDNGVMYPTYSFYYKCKGEGVKPIFGCQVAVAARTRFDKEAKKDEKSTELVILAKNLTGYLNLIKVVSQGHLEGFYYRARVDRELLKEHKEGLICLSGGENGEIFKNFLLGNNEQAKAVALEYKEIFGDDFYLEIQRTGIHAQEIVNPKIIELSRETGIPLVATNNVYYEKQDDAEAREVLWCIDGGRQMSDPARRKPESNQEYFRTPEEMEAIFSDLPEAIANTVKIADSVEAFSIGFGKVQPTYPNIPEGETEESYLRTLVFKHAEERFGYFTPDLEHRLNEELKVIHDKGYDGYFLVVWDIANWARSHEISVNARGSAAGSAVTFILGISTVDPIKWKLFFERFLNPERPSFPDIDLDIADNRRDELIEHVKKTYGYENVTNVAALGKLTTKAAIRDVGRVLAVDLKVIDRLSKLIPVKFGRVVSINACLCDNLAGKEIKVLDENREAVDEFRRILKTEDGETESPTLVPVKQCPDCQAVYWGDERDECKKCHKELAVIQKVSPKFSKLIQYVQKIEGCIRNVSTHACGHLITPKAVTNYCPIQVETGSGKRIITQLEGKYLEEIGLMKFDFLGLANLSIIDTAIKLIRQNKIPDFDINKIPEDDKNTYDLLKRGDTTAVFQLESPGMRKYLKELQPENLEEISAMCALYRPGPIQFIPAFINRKFGREEVKYLIPEIEEIMKISYGLPVYQEQILQIANKVAGYSLGQADVLRRAMGKKDPAVMAAEEQKFVEGVIKTTGHSEDIAKKLWQYAIPFADYGFNKSHTAAYGLIAYQTGYLKANFPSEFSAALMLSDIDNLEKLVRDILDAEARGIKILPPDINKSDAYFTIEEEGVIRFGIGGLKGVGLKGILSLVNERTTNGEFLSLDDLCERINHKEVSKGAIEALIKVGAMQQWGSRAALLQIFEEVYIRCQKFKSTASSGFMDMFGGGKGDDAQPKTTTKVPVVPEVEDIQKIQWEKEILGVPLTPSLLSKLVPFTKAKKFALIGDVPEMKEDDVAKVFGQVKAKKVIQTKKGDAMCFIDLVDATGKLSVTVFPKLHAKVCDSFVEGDYLSVKGKTQKRNDEMQLLASEIKPFTEEDLKKKWDQWMKLHGNDEVQSTIVNVQSSIVDAEYSVEDLQAAGTEDMNIIDEPKAEYKAETMTHEVVIPSKEGIQKSEPVQPKVEAVLPPTPSNGASPTTNQEPIMQSIVEIYVKKDAFIDDLRKLSETLRQNLQENGCEVYIHVPNHESVRRIKLEGTYNANTVKELKDEVIERIQS
jgi:DNA polymerase III subunit alpha